MTETLGVVLLLALVPVAVLDWISSAILVGAARHDGTALRERAGVAVILAVVLTLYFVIGLNTTLGFPWFPLETTVVLNRTLFLLLGIIPARWLWLYWRGRF